MKGSEKGLRGPPFAPQPGVQRPSPAPSHTVVSSSSSNNSNMNNTNNYRQDSAGGRNAFAARVSAACGSDGSTRSSNQPHHHHWPRGPPRDQGGTDDHRHWIYNATLPRPSADKFVVVSYNILGVDNATQHWKELYWHIPSFIMEWNYRKRRILLELALWSPDIICLQEVDRFEDLQTDLVQRGYEGVHKGRTGGSTDGCAIFWRTKKCDLLQEESIEYQELNLRHNVAQLCVLQIRHGEQNRGKGKKSKGIAANRVVVCNIHVLFNPNRGDIKLGQIRHLLEKAYSLSHEWGGIPVVLAGDFNSVPQSPLYQFVRDAVLDLSCYDRRAISGQVDMPQGVRRPRVERWTSTSQIRVENGGQMVHSASIVSAECSIREGRSLKSLEWTSEELETATGSPTDSLMKHNLKLASAYASVQGSMETRDTNNEPLVTTYHGNFRGTVDYIWFTGGLASVKVLEVVPVHILQRTKGLPSKKWGSDHLALACEFAFSD